DLLGADWTEEADVLVALGHPVRLRLLQRVLGGATTVAELVDTDGVGTSGQVYHHLRQLTAAGWLRALGGGRYEVPVARVVPLLAVAPGGRRGGARAPAGRRGGRGCPSRPPSPRRSRRSRGPGGSSSPPCSSPCPSSARRRP